MKPIFKELVVAVIGIIALVMLGLYLGFNHY